LTWLALLLLALILLVIAAVAFRNPLLRTLAEYNINQQTGLQSKIGGLNVGFRSSSLSVTDCVLANPPGFGDTPFLRVPELYLKLDPAHSLENTLAFEEIRFHLASLSIVKNQAGHFNFEAITNAPAARPTRQTDHQNTPSFGGIGKLSLIVGTLSYTDLAQPELSTEAAIDLHAETTQLLTAQDLTNWVGGLITRVAVEQYFKPSNRNKNLWKHLLEPNASP